MHAENGVHVIQAAFFHVMAGFRADFLPHLEQQLHLAGERVPVGAEDLRCSQQHGRVAVVAAGVHDPGVLRSIGFRGIRFLDGQGVDIRPEHQRLPRALGTLDGTHTAGDVRERLHGDAHFRQFFHNVSRGVFLFPPQFRVGMKIMPLFQDIVLFGGSQCFGIHQQAPPSGSRVSSLLQSKVSAVRRASFFSLSTMSSSSSSS